MMDVEYFYDSEYDRWNARCTADHDINCTWYTKQQMLDSIVAQWNAANGASLTVADVNLIEVSPW